MNHDILTKKENRMIVEHIYGFGRLNSTKNNNSNNNNNIENSKQQRSKKNSKGTEVHPRDNAQGQVPENSIQEIPIGYPVDEEKLKDLKKKIKKEDEKNDYENEFVQENQN
jgi:hypothetical protein